MALALALTLLSAGCSDEARPDDTPTLKSPTPSPSPTLPANAATAAEQAVRAYYAAVNRALVSGDVAPVDEFTAPSCPCRGLTRYIREQFAKGGLRGAAYTVDGAIARQANAQRGAIVSVTYDVTAYDELAPDGSIRKHYPAIADALKEAYLRRSGDDWIITDIVSVKR